MSPDSPAEHELSLSARCRYFASVMISLFRSLYARNFFSRGSCLQTSIVIPPARRPPEYWPTCTNPFMPLSLTLRALNLTGILVRSLKLSSGMDSLCLGDL